MFTDQRISGGLQGNPCVTLRDQLGPVTIVNYNNKAALKIKHLKNIYNHIVKNVNYTYGAKKQIQCFITVGLSKTHHYIKGD